MPRTPVPDEPTKNPYITKAISKSLLTPCRQVGLSRKRKTPTSANTSFSPNTVNTPSSLDTTPLCSNLISNNVQEGGSQINSENEKGTRTGRVSKRLIAEDADLNLENFNKKKCVVKIEQTMLGEAGVSSKKDPKCCQGTILSTTEINPDDTIIRKSENKSKTSQNKKPDVNISISKDFVTTDDDFQENMSSKKLKGTKKMKSRPNENFSGGSIHEGETSTLLMEHFDPNPVKHTKIEEKEAKETKTSLLEADLINYKSFSHNQQGIELERHRLHKESNDTKEKNTAEFTTSVILATVNNENLSKCIQVEQKTKKIKRCLSLKKSSEDFKNDAVDYNIILKECSNNLSPSVSKCLDGNELFPRVSSTEIKDLDKQVKQKRKLIDELKQAEIYQKKHDLKELAALTSVWKTGCISALKDLLPQLQTHAPIDMETLLTNLNIPKEIVTVSQDGELI